MTLSLQATLGCTLCSSSPCLGHSNVCGGVFSAGFVSLTLCPSLVDNQLSVCWEESWMCEAGVVLEVLQLWDSGGGISILGHVQNVPGHGPEQPDPALECSLAPGLGWGPPGIPSNLILL